MPREFKVMLYTPQGSARTTFGFPRAGVAAIIIAIVLPACGFVGIEEPAYEPVARSVGGAGGPAATRERGYELRDYPPRIVAEVSVSGDQKEAAGKGFRLLADYIFGGNSGENRIAMTAPVAQQPDGSRIAMTAPVSQFAEDGRWTVRFTMPASYSLDSLPTPNNPAVRLRELPASRQAVLRFSGRADEADVKLQIADLLSRVRLDDLQVLGAPTLAQYNPPWTLWFLRRNEILVPVAREEANAPG